jgi:hypothetical protein
VRPLNFTVSRHEYVGSVVLPVIFLLGPSGAGKSTLAAAIRDKFGALHVEIDRHPQDGIDVEGLRAEWDTLWIRGDARVLAIQIRSRTEVAAARGTVLSFPSGVILSDSQIVSALCEAITPVVLYGTRDDCLQAFLTREEVTGRNLTTDHWIANSSRSHVEFGAPRFAPYRVQAFSSGSFRTIADIATEVWQRAG